MPRTTTPDLAPATPRRRATPSWAWGSLLIAGAITAPMLAVAVTAATRPDASFIHIATTTLPEMLRNSALLALLVGIMAGSAGAVSAWIVSTCDFRGRRLL